MSVSVSINAVDPKCADEAWSHFIADDMEVWVDALCAPTEKVLEEYKAQGSGFKITEEVVYGSKRNDPEIKKAVARRESEVEKELELGSKLESLRFMIETHDGFVKEVSESYSDNREWLLEYLIILDIGFMTSQSEQGFDDYYFDISSALGSFFQSLTADSDFESLIGEYNPVFLDTEQQVSLFSNLTPQSLESMKSGLEKDLGYKGDKGLISQEFDRCMYYVKEYRNVVKYAKDNNHLILIDIEGDKTLNTYFRNRAEEIYGKIKGANILS